MDEPVKTMKMTFKSGIIGDVAENNFNRQIVEGGYIRRRSHQTGDVMTVTAKSFHDMTADETVPTGDYDFAHPLPQGGNCLRKLLDRFLMVFTPILSFPRQGGRDVESRF